MASISPNTPAETRSSSSTPSGSRAQIRSPLYLTSGRYISTRRLRSSWFDVSCLNSSHSCSTSSGATVVAMHSSMLRRDPGGKKSFSFGLAITRTGERQTWRVFSSLTALCAPILVALISANEAATFNLFSRKSVSIISTPSSRRHAQPRRYRTSLGVPGRPSHVHHQVGRGNPTRPCPSRHSRDQSEPIV